jgi:hypothetical protein
MRLLGDVGQLAADWGQDLFTKQQFVQGMLQELSVCLCQYNAMLERGVAGFLCQSQWHCHQAWPDSAFGGCLEHGLECLGVMGRWIGLAVVFVMSKSRFQCHSVLVCCAVLPSVQETAFLGVRVCACQSGSVL